MLRPGAWGVLGQQFAAQLQESKHKDILCSGSAKLLQKPLSVLPVRVAIGEDPVPMVFPVLCQDLVGSCQAEPIAAFCASCPVPLAAEVV